MSEIEKTEQTPVNIAENTSVSNTQADENTPKAKANPNFTPNYNIRNARITDVNFIKTFAINGKSIAQALAEVVKLAQKPNMLEMESDQALITYSDELIEFANDTDKTVNDTVIRLLSELKAEKENSANLRLSIESNKPAPANPCDALITFDNKTAENITKVRRHCAVGKYLVWEKGNSTDFLNKLVNHAVNKVLRIDFDNLINPL